jgi:hypothetical protein
MLWTLIGVVTVATPVPLAVEGSAEITTNARSTAATAAATMLSSALRRRVSRCSPNLPPWPDG